MSNLKDFLGDNAGVSNVSISGNGNGSTSVTITKTDGSTESGSASLGHNHGTNEITGLGNAAERDYTISTGSPLGGSNGDVWYQV